VGYISTLRLGSSKSAVFLNYPPFLKLRNSDRGWEISLFKHFVTRSLPPEWKPQHDGVAVAYFLGGRAIFGCAVVAVIGMATLR